MGWIGGGFGEGGMLGGCCSFWKRSAEDRGVARARGISVCTGTSGGRRRDCSPVSKRMPSRCFLFSVNVWSAGGFHSRCLKSCELHGMDEVVCVCAPVSNAFRYNATDETLISDMFKILSDTMFRCFDLVLNMALLLSAVVCLLYAALIDWLLFTVLHCGQ